MALLTRWAWAWVNSGSWWWTGRPGVLQFMGSQRVGHDWATELIHTYDIHGLFLLPFITCLWIDIQFLQGVLVKLVNSCVFDSWNLITMVNRSHSFSLCNNILNSIQQETYAKELLYRFSILASKYKVLWASLVAQWLRIYLQCKRHRFHLWVRKHPWRRKWQATPIFLPEKFHGQRNLVVYCHGVAKMLDLT